LEAEICDNEEDQTLMLFYYNGESCMKNGKVEVDLGAGPFPIENRINGFCEGA